MGALPNLDDEHVPSSEKPLELEAESVARLGHTLAQKYVLETVVGSGGMAHVYRAKNDVIGRTVAIKILRNAHAKNEEIVQRFLREARTANLVRHPNVVDIIDVAQDEDGAPFIVQEFLEGETVSQYAQRLGGTVPVGELIEIIQPVLSALAEAHDLGVVHRDLKPENIFLANRRGKRVPKVLDFGISKVRGAEMTTVGMMMGTPAYMAPELIRSSRDADPRSDFWAMGVLIFEALTARVPFDGETVTDIFLAIGSSPPARLSDARPDLPASLSRVVERCLQREPGDRYQTATELTADLENVAAELKARAAELKAALPLPASNRAPVVKVDTKDDKPADDKPGQITSKTSKKVVEEIVASGERSTKAEKPRLVLYTAVAAIVLALAVLVFVLARV